MKKKYLWPLMNLELISYKSFMKDRLSTALLISTYNNQNYLELCLNSVLKQSVMPDEIVIADDGSTIETYDLIKKYKSVFSIPIIHVWQEDNGFQAGRIRNIAIAASTAEYIIQIDGDIVLHPLFIEDHINIARRGYLVQGSRVMIGPKRTKEIMYTKTIKVSFFSTDIARRENAIRCLFLSRYLLLRYRNPYPIYYARGANMSFFKQDFLAVNGYDESFVGWGHEDSDLTLRMLNYGCRKMYAKFSCIAYHLYHGVESRCREGINKQIMLDNERLKNVSCKLGVSAHIHQTDKYILD